MCDLQTKYRDYDYVFTLYHIIPTVNDPVGKAFSKHYGKRRKCWQPAFSPFPIMFSTLPKQISSFYSHLFCRLQMLSIWTSLKNCLFVKS